MKILVTGGAGYIGSITSVKLLQKNHEVVIYDNLDTGFREAIPKGAEWIFGDIRDLELLTRVMKDRGIEAVIHFAAKSVVPESVAKPLDYYDVNVMGGLRVMEAARRNQVNKFVFSSSASVYGNPKRNPAKETEPILPLNPYGSSKAMVEQFLGDFEEAYGMRSVSLRYFNVAGASTDGQWGQRTKNASHLIKVAAEVACGKRPRIAIYGTDYDTEDGTCVRDYIHVEDLADAHVLTLDALSKGECRRAYNCGYGRGFSVQQVLQMMKQVSGQDFTVVKEGRRLGDAEAVVADASLLKEELGWRPERDDLEIICRTAYEWEKKI